MKTRNLLSIALAVCTLTLFGCGGGGGGGTGGVTPAATTITGVASKGIFVNGKVKVFAVNVDGAKGTLLETAEIGSNGSYSATIGSYVGAVITEASGDYKDEATGGAIKTVSETAPLRAAVEKVEGETKIAITPLTEIAVKKLEDPTTKKIAVTAVEATNKLVAEVFHVADIINTMPVDATATTATEAKPEQKEYALALAAVSQMMQTSGQDLTTVVTQVTNAITVTVTETGTSATIATETAKTFQTALTDFASDTTKNKTGINDVTSTNLVNVGGGTATLKLKTQGSVSALNGVQATVTLPAGVTLKAENGVPLAGVVTVSGAAPADSMLSARYVPPAGTEPAKLVIGLINSKNDGFGLGEFVTVKCDVAPGGTVSSASFTSASFSNFKAVDGFGVALPVTFAAEVI